MIVAVFQPGGGEASFWVVSAEDATGTTWYHPELFYSYGSARGFADRVRDAGQIDPSRWRRDYPRSDLEVRR